MAKRSLKDPNYIYDGGELPEIVVSPAPWQIDYMKNFGDKDIRSRIRRTIGLLKKKNANINYVNRRNNFQNINIEEALKSELDKTYDYVDNNDIDYTPHIQRLYNVWNEAGRPIITYDKNPVLNNIKGYKYRANILENPIKDVIFRANDAFTIVSELAHPIQTKYGKLNGVLDKIKGMAESFYNEVLKGNHDQYSNENNYEYETHKVIEPELINYIANGVPTKYINSYKRRSIAELPNKPKDFKML